MVFITIVTGAYKPTYILGASHCIFPRGGIYNRKSVWKIIFGNCSVGGIYNGYIVGYIMDNMDDFMMLFTPIEQCSKPLLVDDYKGLYYPVYGDYICINCE